MLFNSYIFIFLFLPVTWLLFRFACKKRVPDVAIAILVFASLVFYSYWNPPFVFLILFSIFFNFSWGRLIEKGFGKSRILLWIGIAVNLAMIGYFKYGNFFMENISAMLGHNWNALNIFLPLGISFFTFQQIAYLIDCFKGKAREHAFLHYALFVTFFPQLIAGPIVRYEQIMPQFERLRTYGLNYRNIAIGLALFGVGLFKKVVIADTLSPWVAGAFDSVDQLTFFEAWAGALSYTFQIYFDFSGYSDMAIGLGKLFNIDLPLNFNSPYKATSIVEFWRCWHISLSTFLRDYLYIPLGGNRRGKVRQYLNTLITMFLGGLWHGAAWTFVFWGSLHGIMICINHGWCHISKKIGVQLPRIIGWLITFPAVCFAWVFFRAVSFERAWNICRGMLGLNGFTIPPNYLPAVALQNFANKMGVTVQYANSWHMSGKKEILVLAVCFYAVALLPNNYEWMRMHFCRKRPSSFWAISVGGIVAISICFLNRISEFLYFQF